MSQEILEDRGSLGLTGSSFIYDTNPVPFTPWGTFGNFPGNVQFLVNEWKGQFEDFASWPIVSSFSTDTSEDSSTGEELNPSDPAVGGYLLGKGSATLPNDLFVLGNWDQSWVSFVPARETSFVIPKVSVGTVPSEGYALLDAFQFAIGGARTKEELPAWEPAKLMGVNIRAVRVNRSRCNSFEGNNVKVFGRPTTTVTEVVPTYHTDRSKALQIQMTNAPENYVREAQLFEVVPGEYLTASLRYRSPELSGAYAMRIDFYTIRGNYLGGQISPLFKQTAFSGIDEFMTNGLITEVPENAYLAEVYYLIGNTPVVGDLMFLDQILIEKNTEIQEYFDGDSSPVSDYLWREGVTWDNPGEDAEWGPGSTWSFYYQDRILRHNIVVRTLEDNVPFGITLKDPEYAVGDGPTLDGPEHPPGTDLSGGGDGGDIPDPNETSGYGYGRYGISMPYGASYTLTEE